MRENSKLPNLEVSITISFIICALEVSNVEIKVSKPRLMLSWVVSPYEYKSWGKKRIFDQLGTQWWGKEEFYCWYFYWLAYKLHQTPITSEFVFHFSKVGKSLKKSLLSFDLQFCGSFLAQKIQILEMLKYNWIFAPKICIGI